MPTEEPDDELETPTDPGSTKDDGGGGTAWRLTKMMVDAFQSKDEKYAAVLENKDEQMAEANAEAMAGANRTIRLLWISLMLCIILLGVVAGAIGTGKLQIAGIGEIGLGTESAEDGDGPSMDFDELEDDTVDETADIEDTTPAP